MTEPTHTKTDFIDDEYVEVYYTYRFTDTDITVDTLREANIACNVRKLAPSQFPINVGKHGQTRIAVHRDQLDEAIAIIRQAREDGAISDDGGFVFEE
ncbi:MAG: hypothetical protein H0U74_08240 [Bradymonadaceae bacterium]|nr:hypothetical protein [Lujinxingiaceae bacterium]